MDILNIIEEILSSVNGDIEEVEEVEEIEEAEIEEAETEEVEVVEEEIELYNLIIPFFNVLYHIDQLLFSDSIFLPIQKSIDFLKSCNKCEENEEENEEEIDLKEEEENDLKEEILFKGTMNREENYSENIKVSESLESFDFELIEEFKEKID